MALWYDSKNNEYASDGKKGWIKSYCDKALSEFNNLISAHFKGQSNRHMANDLDFDSSMTVEEKLIKIEDESNAADSRLKAELESEINKKADSITNGGFVAGGGRVSEDEGAVVIGNEAESSNGISIGSGTLSKSGIAVGRDAKVSANNGVQLGAGENTKDKTLKVYDYQITDFDFKTGQSYIKDIGKLSDINLNISDVADAINTLVDTDEDTINLIGNIQNLHTSAKENIVEAVNEINQNISIEVNTRIEADENIKKEIPVKTTENITSETTDNISYVTPVIVKNAVNNLIENSEQLKNIADNIAQKADKVTNGGFIAGGAEAGGAQNISIGDGIASTGERGVVIGAGAEGASHCVAIGSAATAAADNAVSIGYGAESLADNAVQIGDGSNSDKETLKFRDYKIVECDNNSNTHYLKDIGRIINFETKDKSSVVGAVNEIYKNLELSLIVPNAISQSVIMTKDSDGKYKFSFTFNNAYITSNRLFDNDFKSQINNTFEIKMFDAVEFNRRYYLYLEWDLVRDEFTMFSTAENFGTNLDTECLQFYIGQFTIVDDKTVDYYDEQEKVSVNLVPMIGNYLSRLDYKCYELQRYAAKKNTAVLLQELGKTEEFNIWQNGNWIVGYSIPPITITDDAYGKFTFPSQMLEAAGVKDETGEEKKYCYASYTLNTDNLLGELSDSDVTVTCNLKEAKGKPNSYVEIEDETKLVAVNIYLGTIILNAEDYMTPDGTPGIIYSGSETKNTEIIIDLLRIFTESTTVSGELVEITADEVSSLF